MAHAAWKGNISFGLLNIPVSLHNAETLDRLSFHMLDKRDMSPIKYKTVNANTGDEVPRKEIVKGYEYKKNRYVIMSDDDLKRANVKATHTIDIQTFVDESEIEPQFFTKPYYIEPGERAQKSYAILREALQRTGKAAVAKIVMHDREHLAALMVREDAIVLELLRFAHEIKKPDKSEIPSTRLRSLEVHENEIKMAEELIDEMTQKFDPSKYRDEYQEDLKAFIQEKLKKGKSAKARNAPTEEEEVAQEGKVVDFRSLLKRSVERAGKEKHGGGGHRPHTH